MPKTPKTLKIVEKKEDKDIRLKKEKIIASETDIASLNQELELTGQHSTLLMVLVDLGSTNKRDMDSYSIRELKNRRINIVKLLDKFENVFKEYISLKYKMEKLEDKFSKIPVYLQNDTSIVNRDNLKLYHSYLAKEKELDVCFHFLKSEIMDVYEYFRVNVAKLYLLFSDYNFTTIQELKKLITKINFRYLEEYLDNTIYQKILLFQNIRVKFSHTPDANGIFRTMNLRKFSTIKNTLVEAYDLLLWLFEDNKEKMHTDFAKRFLLLNGKNYSDEEIFEQLTAFNEHFLNVNTNIKK